MRIALIGTYYTPTIGGVEKVIQELAERYVSDGHEVHVFCSDFDKHKRIEKKYEVINGVYIHRSRYWIKLSLNTILFPGYIWDLLWQKYDVVHSHVSQKDYVFFAGIIAFLKGKRHIHTTHCPWTDKFRPLSVRIPLFFAELIGNRVSYLFCSKIIAITPWEIPTLKKWTSERKICIIRNGMDACFFSPVKNNTFKQQLGIKEKMVLFFGRLHPTKAPDVFVQMAQEILKERKDLDFVLVGPDEGEMQRVKEMIGQEKRIHVYGSIQGKEKIATMYQAASVFVLPSYREGLPLSIFEAMASGLPLVATPCNGVPYEIEEGKNGYLVPYGDIALLKEKVIYLIENPRLAKKIGGINKKKVKSYTWDSIAKETFALYDSY
ncbi:MAG: glycosyltransferase [archaeon GW2011_AR17]|nr:MAG: glycosyltransferase [archaeon GW2011_AR17]MBS3154172.1 glycosyltransferase family 4 protein [Candidatus Woesearchaeota archaeon]HIH14791.1 glycosyltransferase family 4 protein [Nanoarchaeota archaeon]HIH59058.1 glycosyltransferase family 4 protein [Nanoarchaeota archaeon]HII14446.1 glycosyltransferase family 4 protein [Nanoarchaeota archaeon]